MFEFLKRPPTPPAKPARRRKSAKPAGAAEAGIEPVPVPEVTEGSEQSDWALWEDSVVALDSQMQSLGPSSRSFPDTAPTGFDELDPFARVTKKDK